MTPNAKGISEAVKRKSTCNIMTKRKKT